MENEMEKEGKSKGTWIFFWVGVAASLVLGWLIFPGFLYSTKHQPAEYSHAKHGEAGAGLQCEECHFFRDDGSYAGIPPLAKCLECHESPQGDTKAEADFIKLAEKLSAENKNIPWLIYSKQPDNVFFSHGAHLKMAKLKCEECHKLVGGKTDKNPPFRYRWISGYAPEVMMMETCESCHQKKGASNACFVCHK